MFIGTAGWAIPAACKPRFAGEGSLLARYARSMGCVEINSSFYRRHAASTYAAWAVQTPPAFRFSVKLPNTITHTLWLRRTRKALEQFLGDIEGLGDRLGVLLVQLPPSLIFEPRIADRFFELLRGLHAGAVVCEPRHASWLTTTAERCLVDWHIGRVAADPAPAARAALPGGWRGPGSDAVVYHRWHGSPRMYWSGYSPEWIAARASEAAARLPNARGWYIFDNTAAGHALANALDFEERVLAVGQLHAPGVRPRA